MAQETARAMIPHLVRVRQRKLGWLNGFKGEINPCDLIFRATQRAEDHQALVRTR
jgi:hypothetical protein